mgnify:CR=1 FL=1
MNRQQMLEKVENLSAYEVKDRRFVEEMNSEGMVLEHRKSGARLFLMSNEDDNKVFSIGFRTPPADSTGLPHILEHSVLEGSEKFPVKDPFVELVKGSLNTFLNAMTYPDKTVYPVASCNDKDFQNLMDVYLDGVFHPSIYREPKIFKQEGWHYELPSEDAPLTVNGVVYNEMKGAFSSPESVLERFTSSVLFPDTPYSNESGGDPAVIPNLSYEQFIQFHKDYYHPANSYIYLYGDMDMEEKLLWLDKEYLSAYDKKDFTLDSSIALQKPFTEPVEKETTYSVTANEGTEDNTYLSLNTVVGTDTDPILYVAFQILDYTLISAPGAPLKQALIDAHIGQDIMGGYENGILQPYFSVIAKNADGSQKEAFLKTVKGTLKKLADDGINQKSLMAGINYYEFRSREADFGNAPKGLMYGLQCLDSWLYGGDPLMHLEYEETFAFLKKAAKEGYFEELIRKYLLDNPFEAVITVSPKRGLTAIEDEKLREKLEAYKKSLGAEEIQAIVDGTKELKEYQDTPSPKEDLEKIPLLKRSDIRKEAEKFILTEREIGGTKVLAHELFTSGIGYLRVMFRTDHVPSRDLPYVGLLKAVLGFVDTTKHTYSDLSDEINLNTGGITLSVSSYADSRKQGAFTGIFTASARVLCEKLDFGFSAIAEILLDSILDDEKRLGEIVAETKSKSQMRLNQAAHSAAVMRASSYFSAESAFDDCTGGIGFYQFLEETAKHFEEKKGEVIAKLKETAARLFTKENMLISYTAAADDQAGLEAALPLLKERLPQGDGTVYPFEWKKENLNEGFMTSSQVNYLARCGNFVEKGLAYKGTLRTLKVILGYDYLWINVRVKGGAYGVMNGAGRFGDSYFVSYRDPNLRETNEVYEGIVPYLEQFEADERDMTKFVIGTISDLDAPLLPPYKGIRADAAWFTGVTDAMVQKERDEILAVTPEDIRELAPIIRAVLSEQSICAIGNAEKVKANQDLFKTVKNLFN